MVRTIKEVLGMPVPETESVTLRFPLKMRHGHDVTSAEGVGTNEVKKGRIVVGCKGGTRP